MSLSPLASAVQAGILRAELLPPTFTNFEFDASTFKIADPTTITRHVGQLGAGSTYGVSDPRKTLTGTLLAAKAKAFVVTPDATANTFTTASAHGLAAGDPVYRFTAGTTLPGGVSASTVYYVIASGLTSTVFKVSTTLGGSALDITDTGTGTITAYVPFKSLPFVGATIQCKDSTGPWYGIYLTVEKADISGLVQGQPAMFEVQLNYDPQIQAYYGTMGAVIPTDIDA